MNKTRSIRNSDNNITAGVVPLLTTGGSSVFVQLMFSSDHTHTHARARAHTHKCIFPSQDCLTGSSVIICSFLFLFI